MAVTPTDALRIQEPGYYDFSIGLELASVVTAPSVYVTRTRDDVEVTVWPPDTLGTWTAPFPSKFFEGVAPAIPCKSGDEIRVYVSHGEGSPVDLVGASLAAYLVDRVPPGQEPGYRELILSHEPIAYWRLGEPTTGVKAFDETGHGHEGTFSSPGPTAGVDGLINDPNTAMTFAGNHIAVTTDNLDQFQVSEISLEAWISTTEAVDRQMIISRESFSPTNRVFFFQVQAGKAEFELPSTSKVTGVTDVADGEPHHLVATYDGTTCRVYVDGQLDNSGDLNEALKVDTPSSVRLAAREGITEFPVDGTLDEIAVYGRVLTAAEIASHYQVGRSG